MFASSAMQTKEGCRQSELQLQSWAQDPRSPDPGPPPSSMIVEENKHSPAAEVPEAGPGQPQLGRPPIVQLSAQVKTSAAELAEATMPMQVPRQASAPPAGG